MFPIHFWALPTKGEKIFRIKGSVIFVRPARWPTFGRYVGRNASLTSRHRRKKKPRTGQKYIGNPILCSAL